MEITVPLPLSFDGNVSENWRVWKEQFNAYLKSEGRNDNGRPVDIFLGLVGIEGILLFNKLNLNPETAALDQVLAAFESHCTRPSMKNVVLERFKFLSTRRRDGQTFDQFLTEMKNAAARCEFTEMDNMIRDQLIFQLEDRALRDRLLGMPDLTLDKLVEQCRVMESWAHAWPSWSPMSAGTSELNSMLRHDGSNGVNEIVTSSVRSVITSVQPDPVRMVTAVLENLNGHEPRRLNNHYHHHSRSNLADDDGNETDSSVLSLPMNEREWRAISHIVDRDDSLKMARVLTQASSSSSSSSSSDSSDGSDIEELPPPPRPEPIVITIDEDTDSDSSVDSIKQKKKKLKTEEVEGAE